MKDINLQKKYDKRTIIKMLVFFVCVETAHCLVRLFLGGDFLGGTEQRTLICNMIVFIIAIILFRSFYIFFIKKTKENHGKNAMFVIGLTLIAFVVNLVTSILAGMITGAGKTYNTSESVITISYVLITIISSVIIAPIVEETLYRMCLFGCIYKKNRYLAYAVSALWFAFGHISYSVIVEADYIKLVNMLPFFAAGILLAYIYEYTGNIICPVITHMTINLVAALIGFY